MFSHVTALKNLTSQFFEQLGYHSENFYNHTLSRKAQNLFHRRPPHELLDIVMI